MQEPNTPEYRKFKNKRKLWVDCLSGDDRHSVQRQISKMLWYAAAFRVVNEARRLAPPAKEGGVELNGTVHCLLDHGFFTSQMIAVRRLNDRSGLRGKEGVYSLGGLLRDMMASADLMTREHLLAAERLEYDYRPVRAEYDAYCREQERAGETGYGIPEELDWERHELRHQVIDRLACIDRKQRAPTDPIPPEVFGRLDKKMKDACRDVHNHVNKFVAHAASPESRVLVNADDNRVTLGQLWTAHETISKVANFVSIYILHGPGYGGLPIPQYDHLAHIERPLVSRDDVEKLAEEWRRYEEETQKWASWGLDEFDAECRSK